MLPQLLAFNTSWKEFRVESRNEALGAQGKIAKTDLQIFRYFSGDDFMSPIFASSCI